MVLLENKSQRAVAETRRRRRCQPANILAPNADRSAAGPVQRPEQVEQRCLAAARWSDDRHGLTRRHIEVQPVEHPQRFARCLINLY